MNHSSQRTTLHYILFGFNWLVSELVVQPVVGLYTLHMQKQNTYFGLVSTS